MVLSFEIQQVNRKMTIVTSPAIGGQNQLINAPNSCCDISIVLARMIDTNVAVAIIDIPLEIVMRACA